MVKTGRREHEVTEVGFPSHCPTGHVFAPGRLWTRHLSCQVDNALHSGLECGACGIRWFDLACTILPGWHSSEEYYAVIGGWAR